MLLKVTISSLLQLIFIPITYWILYAIARIFHEPHTQMGSDGMDFYPLTLYYLSLFVIVSLPILNLIQAFLLRQTIIPILLHWAWLGLIIWTTRGDLAYRPYDFGIILFVIGLTIGTRLVFNRILSLDARENSI